ncbi:MAG: toast rack family protein [Bryobacteraceae bacterium]
MAKKWTASLPIVAACVFVLAGCEFDHVVTGPLRDEPVSIEKGSAERANIELNMGAGEMNLRGGAQKLIEGKFEYNVAEWKPIVHSSGIGSHATINIEQPQHANFGGHTRYRWDLQLNDDILLDLAIHCGAGQAQLELGDMKLRDLNVQMGAGQVQLDLRGKPSRDYDVNISGGVGQATVQLPEGVGIWAQAHGGLGSITVTGLEKRGDHWENDLYDKSKVNVRVKVEGGIGEIRIVG